MFEFYFQSGEFESGGSWITDFIIQFFASGIGVGGALWIYWIQYQNDLKKAANAKIDFERDKLRYLKHLVKRNIVFTRIFIEQYEKLRSDLLNDPFDIGDLTMDVDVDLSRVVHSINQEEFYHAYRNQIGSDEIVRVFHSIDVINAIKIDFFEYIEKVKVDFDLNRKKEYADLVNSLQRKLLEEIREIEFNPLKQKERKAYPLYTSWYASYASIVIDDASNIKGINKNFITKAFNEMRNNNHIHFEINIEEAIGKAYSKFKEIEDSNRRIGEIRAKFELKTLKDAFKDLQEASSLLIEVVENNFVNYEASRFCTYDLSNIRIPYKAIFVKTPK